MPYSRKWQNGKHKNKIFQHESHKVLSGCDTVLNDFSMSGSKYGLSMGIQIRFVAIWSRQGRMYSYPASGQHMRARRVLSLPIQIEPQSNCMTMQDDRYLIPARSFEIQYAQLYFARYHAMAPIVLRRASALWPNVRSEADMHFSKCLLLILAL